MKKKPENARAAHQRTKDSRQGMGRQGQVSLVRWCAGATIFGFFFISKKRRVSGGCQRTYAHS
jgi:hypothetical protein